MDNKPWMDTNRRVRRRKDVHRVRIQPSPRNVKKSTTHKRLRIHGIEITSPSSDSSIQRTWNRNSLSMLSFRIVPKRPKSVIRETIIVLWRTGLSPKQSKNLPRLKLHRSQSPKLAGDPISYVERKHRAWCRAAPVSSRWRSRHPNACAVEVHTSKTV